MNKIGVIDSGSGGLTVAAAIAKRFTSCDIHYYADHKHLPYGLKDKFFLQTRLTEISNHLIAAGCDSIVIACHSASAQLANNTSLFGVVEPTKNFIKTLPKYSNIGVIGTRATISSNVYQTIPDMKITTLVTPTLADAIEQQNLDTITDEITLIMQALPPIEYLALACTHYPLAEKIFNDICPKLKIINTPELTARTLPITEKNTNHQQKIVVESSQPHAKFIELARTMLGTKINALC